MLVADMAFSPKMEGWKGETTIGGGALKKPFRNGKAFMLFFITYVVIVQFFRCEVHFG